MGQKVTRVCDSCGKGETANRAVLSIDFKRSDGMRTTGDLCTACLGRMEKEFGLSSTTRQRRTPYKVTDPSELGLS